jgi:hypothetical protein
MEQLVPFEIGSGDAVLVAVVPASAGTGPTVRGLGGATVERVTATTSRSFVEAVQRVIPAAQLVLDAIRRGSASPNEVSVSFGIGLTAGADAFIASATTNANFTVTLSWTRPTDSGDVAAAEDR